jgi:hypothetical protein
VYGIKAAVRRLDFAPDVKEMQVIDVKNGRLVFRPRPGKPVSLADLQKSVTKAGYQIERSRIAVRGTLAPDGRLRVPETGQVFLLVGKRKLDEPKAPDTSVTAAGAWEARQGEQTILLDERGPGEGAP